MQSLSDKIGRVFHPTSGKSSQPPSPSLEAGERPGVPAQSPLFQFDAAQESSRHTRKQETLVSPTEKAYTSKTASCSDIFGMIKALAGGTGHEVHTGDVDSDEDEEGGLELPRRQSPDHVQGTQGDHDGGIHPSDEQAQQEQDRIGAKFAALSISNLTTANSSISASQLSHNERPSLPRAQPSDSDLEADPLRFQLDQSGTSNSSESHTPATSDQEDTLDHEDPINDIHDDKYVDTFVHEKLTDETKLKAIIEEFGEMASVMEGVDGSPSEPEQMLAESMGSLFKGVMLVGNLHLTTHRLLFHAMLPPDSVLAHGEYGTTHSGAASGSGITDLIQAGPVTIHKSGALQATRRCWMELTTDMITTYPKGDEAGRVRPLTCVLLSSVRRMEPLNADTPCDFHVTYDSADGRSTTHFTVDTEQSAIDWRRAFERALFRYARRRWREKEAIKHGLSTENTHGGPFDNDAWNTMRCCIPLDRIDIRGITDYHSFSMLVALDIELQDDENLDWDPPDINEGGFLPDQHPQPPVRPSPLPDGQKPSSGEIPQREKSSSYSQSFRSALSLNRHSSGSTSRHDSRESSPDRLVASPTSMNRPSPSSPLHRQSTQYFQAIHRGSTGYIDSSLPPRLAQAVANVNEGPPNDFVNENAGTRSFSLKIALLNESSWFAEAFEAATNTSRSRKYKQGVERARIAFNIAGYDLLATDEELEAHDAALQTVSMATPSKDTAEPVPQPPAASVAKLTLPKDLKKSEKAALAAKIFGLKEDEGIWLKRCYIYQSLVPSRGHIIITPTYVCFWRRATLGSDIKYRFKSTDIKGASEATCVAKARHGMSLHIHGQHDLSFEFWLKQSRDEVLSRINALAHAESPPADRQTTASSNSRPISSVRSFRSGEVPQEQNPAAANRSPVVPVTHAADILAPPKNTLLRGRAFPDEALSHMPFIANKPWQDSARMTPRHFTCLTIGSRGDVQPYIALGLRLKQDGHSVTIVTHDEFKKWIEGYGIEHRQAGGDPTALMKLSAEHKMFSPGFFKESLGSYRQWLDELLVDSWEACKDADVLIESPSTMSGIHIAEALKIPYFRAFTMPWTRTSAYPQAFMVPAFEMGPSFNYSTYVLFDNIIWRATSGQINRWRKKHLGLKATDMTALSISKIPFLYNFSSAVVPKPLDWHDDIIITGYWNLENSDSEWSPPPELEAFMQKAKDDKKPLVYIGFGSIVVPRPNAMTKSIIKAVEKADVRAIIAKGWSSRGNDPGKEGEQIQFPESCFALEKVRHGWLFPKIDAAMHHGGAGTVGASLRAGIPTLIKPWFGDQFFWANRVTKLEVGLRVSSLRSDEVAEALKKATSSKVMIEKAARVGQRIRSEDGVGNALQAIHLYITRASSDRTHLHWAK